jgi:hypothetical protein
MDMTVSYEKDEQIEEPPVSFFGNTARSVANLNDADA